MGWQTIKTERAFSFFFSLSPVMTCYHRGPQGAKHKAWTGIKIHSGTFGRVGQSAAGKKEHLHGTGRAGKLDLSLGKTGLHPSLGLMVHPHQSLLVTDHKPPGDLAPALYPLHRRHPATKLVCISGLLFPLTKSCLQMAGSAFLSFKSPLTSPQKSSPAHSILRRPSTPCRKPPTHCTVYFLYSTAKLKVCVYLLLDLSTVFSLQKESSGKTTALCISYNAESRAPGMGSGR